MFEINQGILIALEKINAMDLATRKFSGPPRTAIEAVIKATEMANFAKPPAGSIEHITNFSQSIPLIAEAINSAKTKQDLIQDAIFGGGHTVSNLVKITAIDNAAVEASKAFKSWDSISRYITDNASAYKEQLGAVKTISTILQGNSILNTAINPAIFDNQFIKESPRIIDILSANTFANVFSVYESTNSNISLEAELALLNKTLSEDDEVKIAVSHFANNISEANEDYKKIDEIATDFVHKLTSKYGLPKQYAYYIAALIIFVFCVWGKDLFSLKQEAPTNTTNNYTQNIFIEAEKQEVDVILKDTPIYQTPEVNNSKRVGKFKTHTIVQIQKVEKGWCFVKGEAEISDKNNDANLKKDSIIEGWIQQSYLNNFKD